MPTCDKFPLEISQGGIMDKSKLAFMLDSMSKDDLRSLRGMINSRLGRKVMTPEKQAAMQAGRAAKGYKRRTKSEIEEGEL